MLGGGRRERPADFTMPVPRAESPRAGSGHLRSSMRFLQTSSRSNNYCIDGNRGVYLADEGRLIELIVRFLRISFGAPFRTAAAMASMTVR
jgi:hypothetical protein